MVNEEPWINLNGCNACINTIMCDKLGSCSLVLIDGKFPVYNKVKRKMMLRIRSVGHRNVDKMIAELKSDNIGDWVEPELTPRMWPTDTDGKYKESKVTKRLTRLEQMFISELNKPR